MKNKTVETLKSALHFEKFNIAKNENFSCGDERAKRTKGITLIALVITILFSYDEKLKCSNSKGFLLQTI